MKALEDFIDSLNLRHFKGREFTPYWTRKRGGVQNSAPHADLWGNIVPTVVVLDEVRERLEASITLSSTYRSEDYNRAVGGAPFSLHCQFNAIDFQCRKHPPAVTSSIVKSLRGQRFRNPLTGKAFVFKGGVGIYPTFVHIDTRGVDANW